MAVTLTTPNTVLGVLQPRTETARLATNLVIVVLGTLLLAAAAVTKVPTQPIPVNLTTFAVALLAGAFGWRVGVATVALYIVEGLSGLPVFANGGGWGYIMSPSFGFIIGYLPMAYIIGRVADLGGSGKLITLFVAMLVADALLFTIGFLWLLAVSGLILNAGAALPTWLHADNLLGTAFDGAVRPFIIWDVLKMAFAAITVTGAWTMLGRKKA